MFKLDRIINPNQMKKNKDKKMQLAFTDGELHRDKWKKARLLKVKLTPTL